MSAGSGSPAIFFAHFAEFLCVLCGKGFDLAHILQKILNRKGRKETPQSARRKQPVELRYSRPLRGGVPKGHAEFASELV
jgi:hypothetical protein